MMGMLEMDDKLGKVFWAFMGLDAILLLITSSAYFDLSERSIVTLAAIIISASAGLVGVFWSQSRFTKRHIESQEKMDARQRADHQLEIAKQEKQHEYDRQQEREAKLLEKKEELVSVMYEAKLSFRYLRIECDNLMINIKPEGSSNLKIINEKIDAYLFDVFKNLNLADHIALTYFFKTRMHKIIESQKNHSLGIANLLRDFLSEQNEGYNSSFKDNIIQELDKQESILGITVYKLAMLQSPYTHLPLSCEIAQKQAA